MSTKANSERQRPLVPRETTTEGDAMRYQAIVDVQNKNNSHTQLVLMTGKDKKVLEVGPAWGYMSRVLKDRGCRVTGLEIDPVAAKVAEQFCERMIVGDIEKLDFQSVFNGERFDVVVYGDVLEHLVHPERVLELTSTILKPEGYVAASIPNIAHGSVRLALLAGNFRYTDLGLLDKTHLRFYTRDTIRELFRDAGFRVQTWKRIFLDPFGTEVGIREEDFPPRLVEEIREEQDALTYQYIVKATVDRSRRKNQSASRVRSSIQVVQQLGEHIASLESQNVEKEGEIARRDALIASQEGVIASKHLELADKTRESAGIVAEKNGIIAKQTAAIREKDRVIAQKEWQLHEAITEREALINTIGYRFLERTRRRMNRLAPEGTRRRTSLVLLGHGVEVLMNRGLVAFLGGLLRFWRWVPRLLRRATHAPPELPTAPVETLSLDEQYRLWLRANELTPKLRRAMQEEASELAYRPRISVIVPVYNTEPRWLREAIESVRQQIYENWELCLADDGSTRRDTLRTLRRYRRRELMRKVLRRDPRIKVAFLERNQGIAVASDAALALATGDFVGLLDHDDELKPDALYEVVKLLNEDRDLDYIYSDEDKKDEEGRLVEPFFKPDWSPDLLQCINYVTHFSVYRKDLLNEIGGFRSGYEGSQDYDLVLRVSDSTQRIAHIPKPLYTWRKVPGSAAGSVEAKPFAYEAAKRALKDALMRRGFSGNVVDGSFKGSYRVRYSILGAPRVDVIIPTRDRLDLLKSCVESVNHHSTYKNYQIVIVDNESRDKKTLAYLDSFEGRVIRFPFEFNFSKIVNLAARESRADFLLFLNNDTRVITPEWIEALLEHAQRPEVAAVGCRLQFNNGRPQHEGIVVGPFDGLPVNVKGLRYFGLEKCIRNCSAVTAASMMTRREVFLELGGFEERLGVAYNDVDFCMRANEKGFVVVYTPYAQLYHQESKTRGSLHPKGDVQFFRERWNDPEEYRDPYWNPNLDPTKPFRLKLPIP